MKQLGIVCALLGSLGIMANPPLTERCKEDPLQKTEQAMGRNAWAKKCNYIKVSSEIGMNDDGAYVVFTKGSFNGTPNIPVSADAPCISGLTKLGSCQVGCFVPTQNVRFAAGVMRPIAKAFEDNVMMVSAMHASADMSAMRFGDQPIQHYTSGETDELIRYIKMSNGKELGVTMNHPLVNDDGDVVKAKDLKTDSYLMNLNGGYERIVQIQDARYRGKVWNIQPVSKNRRENILVAEGVLTGSVRFQNEWAQDTYRIAMRDEMDASLAE